jgi:porphyrinogen peroxidase
MASMNAPQPAILEPVPAVARYIVFDLAADADAAALREALARLLPVADGRTVVIGVGEPLVAALGGQVPGLHAFPDFSGATVNVPATPHALWCWVRGDDLGELLQLSRKLEKILSPVLRLRHIVDGFRHKLGASGHARDLTGYEDGTENPHGEAAIDAGIVSGQGEGLDGSSFVAVQQWVHDFEAFEALAEGDRDFHFGRRLVDNEEIEDAPAWAHVKRTAQETFEPPAFVLRRSMPWLMSREAGLMFVAFGHSLRAFEAQMRRMAGLDDGVVDAMFRISKPVSGSYYWCPPMRDGQLDLSRLGC